MNYGTTIKTLRKQKGLSQIQLANNANIDNTLLCKIENNSTPGSIKTLQSIAKALEIDVSEIFNKEVE